MSNIYISEPPTSGKVLLKTTVGDIDIELWAKETPKACRNFIQLCLEGYYNNTIFHRLVKGFIVQGGDPKGDGTGGESIYGETFKDEFHSRLRFSRRGIVAMANAGKDDNGSQFFFTLAATPELQNVHTIFGKVTGETVYNMLKLEEGLVEHERPVYPHKIIKTEVLSNPFPDIEPRILEKPVEKSEKKKDRRPGVKNFKLLSFGAEAEEDEEEASVANQEFVGKGKSTHDLLDDPKLSTKTVVEADKPSDSEDSDESEIDHEEELENIRNKLKPDKKKPTTSYYLNKDQKEARKRKAEEIREEIAKVKKEYQQNKLTKEATKVEETKKSSEKSETFKAYKEEFDKYKDKKESLPKKGKTREDFTLSLLEKFKKKLESVKDQMESDDEDENNEEKQKKEKQKKEKKQGKDEDSDPEDTTWMAHKLRFAANEAVLAKDANTKDDDWYEVYDPRNPLNKRRREESSKNLKHKVAKR